MGNLSENFNRYEFSCSCGCDFDAVDAELILVLERLRKHFNAKVTITGGNRCERRNAEVGGSSTSLHQDGKAADVRVEGISADEVADYLERQYPDRYGIGRYLGRTHVDARSGIPARWDRR